METRWTISEDGGETFPITVTPFNPSAQDITWTRDLDKWHAFYRKTIRGPIRFRNADYTYLLNLERLPSTRCRLLVLRMELQCSHAWREVWRGQFTVTDGQFDHHICEFEIRPETVDRYTCLLGKMEVEHNVLDVLPVTSRAVVLPPNVEFGMCSTVPGGDCDDQYRANHGWALAYDWQPFPGVAYHLYWRERINRPCVFDPALGYSLPSPPPGSGWQLIGNACNAGGPDVSCLELGSAVYVRQVSDTYSFGTPQLGTSVSGSGIAVPPVGMDQPLWVGRELGSANPTPPSCSAYPNDFTLGFFGPWFISLANGEQQQYTRTRTLGGVLDYLARQAECGIEGIRSTFFGINPPGGSTGTNYVTGEATETEGLMILQKSDAITPGASNPASVLQLSLADALETLATVYRILWDIDSDGFLRIEHWKHWLDSGTANGLDLRTPPGGHGTVIEPLIRGSLGSNAPRIERTKWAEAQGVDFFGRDIVYTGNCATASAKAGTKEYNLGKVTTDLGFIQFDPAAIDKRGFVLLATRYNSAAGVHDVIISPGALSGSMILNAPLSWANLHRDFWTWDRYLPTGQVNGEEVAFDHYRPTLEQKNVRVIGFGCGVVGFDPRKLLTTTLGEQYLTGAKAEVIEATFEEKGGVLRMDLRYAR